MTYLSLNVRFVGVVDDVGIVVVVVVVAASVDVVAAGVVEVVVVVVVVLVVVVAFSSWLSRQGWMWSLAPGPILTIGLTLTLALFDRVPKEEAAGWYD